MADSISTRCAKLNQIFAGKNVGRKSCGTFTREALLDAFLLLFDECNSACMLKDKNISGFVKKYQPMVDDLRKICLSKEDFEVLNIIGRGHFGQVQVVKDKQGGDVFAMKTLKKSQTLAQESVAFYDEEREIMALCNNPWITSLQYAFQDINNLYLVMEYHPGGDLLSLLSKHDDVLEEDVARFYLAEMVMAIHSLHVLGYVHRDIKPDNVLIDRTGHIKLADFGSSARLSADKKVHSKMPVGTPEYIAPEVLTSMDGSGVPYGVECDWWSLGVVAFEMLCGQTPFEADSVVITYSKIMNYKTSLQFSKDAQVSKNTRDLILKLCTDCKSRMAYEGLLCHQFFSGIEWNSLQETVPPYVPNLDGAADTSHFDEFEPESPDVIAHLEKYNLTNDSKGFTGKDLPFVGFTFSRNLANSVPFSPRKAGSLPNSPMSSGMPPSRLERKLTIKAKELKDALQSCHTLKGESVSMKKSLEEVQTALEQKEKALRNAEYERDLLEKEKVLYDTQVKDLQRRLDLERAERNKSDSATLKLLSELKEDSQKANDLRDQESRENLEDLQQIVAQLENDRFIASRRAQRLEEELKSQEKLLEVSKNRINDHQARMTKMNEEAKRSMMVWQEKLDKVTKDSNQRIAELQQKLTKSLQSNQEATELLENVRKNKDELQTELEKLKKSSKPSDSAEVQGKLCRDAQIKRTGGDDNSVRERFREKSAEVRKLQSKIMDLEDQLFQSQRSQKKLEKEAANSQAQERRLQEMEKELDILSRYKRKMENTNCRLESELEETKKLMASRDQKIDTLTEKCRILEEMLEKNVDYSRRSSEADYDNNGKLAINEAELEKLCEEKEVMTRKLAGLESDLKIQQQKNSSLVKQLEDSEQNSRKLAKDMDRRVQELEKQLNEISKERSELRSTKKALEETILKLENEIDTREFELELKASARQDKITRTMQENRSEVVQEIHVQLSEMSNRCNELVSQTKELEKKVEELTDENCDLKVTKEKLEDELNEKKRAAEGIEFTNSMLKSTCTMLENQIEELEIINEDFEEKQLQWNITRGDLDQKKEKTECELVDSRRSLEQEKTARSAAEEKVSKLQDALKEVQTTHINEVGMMNSQLDRQRQRCEELTEALSEAETKYGMVQLDIKSLERKLQLGIENNNKLKIEVERLENQTSKLKSSNFELNQNIEAAMEKCDELTCERAALAEQLDLMEASHAEERLKLEATSSQQSKLIDFLQCKSEGQASKKKKLIGGGSKSWRKKPESINVVPQQWRDLQQALEKERASSLKLQTELNRVRQEMQAAKMEAAHWKSQNTGSATPKPTQSYAVLSAIQQSPSNQPSPLGAQNQSKTAKNAATPAGRGTSHRPKERMHHNIPHRFVNALNMRATKCATCLDTLHFVRPSSLCAECGLVCHVKCAPNLPRTCGLPSQFVEHFTETLQEQKSDETEGNSQSTTRLGGRREGWLRVPRCGSVKHGWEKKWVVLADQMLQLYDKENMGENSSPSEILHLCGKDGHVTVHSAVMSSELIGTAPTDLPYILRVESRQRCWPVQNLYILAPSFPVKQKWVTSLEFVLDEIKKKNIDGEDQKLMGNVLLHLEGGERLDINCTKLLNDELVLLGAEEGLFSLSLDTPRKHSPRAIPGIERAFQIDILSDLNQVIMIAGKDRLLCSVDLKQVTSRARHSNSTVPITELTPQGIEKITNCHLFAVGQCEGNFYICAATPNSILLLRYNASIGTFCTRKEIETSEPCNCIHFSKNYVIYGTGKLYILDIKQHVVKEFLNSKDPSLAFAVYGAAQLNIFPIAVLDVTAADSDNEELLLCFNEFGVFVNSFGSHSRQKPLMWSRLPLAFAYSEPFLFVTHFNSIDVCEIPPIKAENSSHYVHKFLEIQNPRVLGPAVSPGAVYLASTLHEQVEMLCFQGNAAPASVFQPEDDEESMSVISELSRLSSPSRRSSMLARSPSWSPGSTWVKSPKGGNLKKSSTFRAVRPLMEENM
ncbi:citron Rho-interacting kinase-like [Stylophora pistillata]|uniref:citron Rho-interacting kinase-like n=1 Tax=Stylophora pistillata TaxID=50429 RepID=UPI000C043936|nr:citron Rho-interacting kinase-like [Stylophora pistillata]